MERDFFVHESTYVDDSVSVGKGTKIWHFCHIMEGAQIGKHCVLGQNVFVARDVKIGNNVHLQNNVSIYAGVTLEDDVFCGPSMVFTNIVKPRSAFPSDASEYVPTLVKRGATIGANSTILCGIIIGEYAFIGAGAMVRKDIPDYALVYGNPSRQKGWMCQCGTKLNFNEENRARCVKCGLEYKLENSMVEVLKTRP